MGSYEKADGTMVPMWHDSEVAAIAYAVQKIIAQRNVDVAHADVHPHDAVKEPNASGVMAGKKCAECGAHAVIKKDGCEYCTNCGHVGACG